MFLGKDTGTLHELLGYKVVGESLTKWCQMTENQVLYVKSYCTYRNGILSFAGWSKQIL